MTLSSKIKRLRYLNDFNIFDIPGHENIRVDVYNQRYEGHTQMCLTFIFMVNHQGQMTHSKFSEILDIVDVRIDTKIQSTSCTQPEL